ncbi:MAG: ABC transporter substrate-binding protein [Methylophaga sp.]|nr:ABC transporter substrate-binding protein [Methylophaga sp.]
MFYVATTKADEAGSGEPQVIVKKSTEEMLQALKDNEVELEQDPSIIFGLVESIIMPHFDFDKMAKLALGKNWRKVSAEQKLQFTEEFRLLLIRTYSTAMLEYTDEEIKFLPVRGELAKKKVKVPMEIIQAGGPPIPMALAMYLNKKGVWKVYDVKIDGISLVTNYRSTFATQIRNEGMDKLIETLAKKNEKVII